MERRIQMLRQKSKLELLQDERKAIKVLYKKESEELVNDLNYLKDNWASILIKSSIDGLKKNTSKSDNNKNNLLNILNIDKEEQPNSTNIFKQAGEIAVASFPFVWAIAQPLLIKYTINKIKSKIFQKKIK